MVFQALCVAETQALLAGRQLQGQSIPEVASVCPSSIVTRFVSRATGTDLPSHDGCRVAMG